VCTPLGLINEGGGVFSLFYTNRSWIPGGWDSLAYLKLELQLKTQGLPVKLGDGKSCASAFLLSKKGE